MLEMVLEHITMAMVVVGHICTKHYLLVIAIACVAMAIWVKLNFHSSWFIGVHYNVLPEAVRCCLLVNYVVYKHVTMTSLLWLQIPTHPQRFKFWYYFLFELWVSNEEEEHEQFCTS